MIVCDCCKKTNREKLVQFSIMRIEKICVVTRDEEYRFSDDLDLCSVCLGRLKENIHELIGRMKGEKL